MDWGNWLATCPESGRLVIEGTDTPLSAVRELWASGHSFRDVPRHFPEMTVDQAQSAFHLFNTNVFE